MTMSESDLIKFCSRSQKEIRRVDRKGVAKVICIQCGEDVTCQECQCNAGQEMKDRSKMMSLADSMFQHLTGFPVM